MAAGAYALIQAIRANAVGGAPEAPHYGNVVCSAKEGIDSRTAASALPPGPAAGLLLQVVLELART